MAYSAFHRIWLSKSIGAVGLAWLITGIGMLLLVQTFKILAEHKPHLNSGIFSYAKAGFGEYIGFHSAWGYWLMTCMGNVALAVMINDSLVYSSLPF